MKRAFFKNPTLKTSLRKQFNGCPPFSVLNAREGYWQKRKRQWIRLGIQSELGRGEMNPGSPGGTRHDPAAGWQNKSKMKGKQEKYPSKSLARCFGQDIMKGECDGIKSTGTSIFDPVLCELMYNWFCPKDGHVLDPFAGGSVRGIVAGILGRDYTGIDLSKNQVIANRKQVSDIQLIKKPKWIIGDSYTVLKKFQGKKKFDFIFTCPPYHNLEVYSEDINDLSTMSYKEFLFAYNKIIKCAVRLLKKDRFLCFIVGEIRDKNGTYKNFVGETITACLNTGLSYHNEAILITAVGSLPIRVGKQFRAGRKLGKTHQNILIFYKGDISKIKTKYPK